MTIPVHDICGLNFKLGLAKIKRKPTTKTKIFKHKFLGVECIFFTQSFGILSELGY